MDRERAGRAARQLADTPMSLPCPACGTKTRVKDTRRIRDGAVIKRRRDCQGCGNRFDTIENRNPLPQPDETSERDAMRQQRNEAIYELYQDGVRQADIADAFGLSRPWISQIVCRQRNGAS